MPEEMITAIALIIAGMVGFITYKRKMSGMTKNQKFIANAKRSGHYTEGSYEDSTVHLGTYDSNNQNLRNKSLKVKYRYQVNGTTYYKYMTFQSPGQVSVDFPVSVTVYYDPRNPKNAVCPEEATKTQQRKSGCLTTLGVTCLTLFVVFRILRFLIG